MKTPNRPSWGEGERYSARTKDEAVHIIRRCIAVRQPILIRIWKRNRWCGVVKLTFLDGQPILAIVHRHQRGVDKVISVPILVLECAAEAGVQYLYWRRDRHPLEMRRISLAELLRMGWRQPDCEIYIPLAKMQMTEWRKWEFAESILSLHEEGE